MTQIPRFMSVVGLAKEGSWASAANPTAVLPFSELTENPTFEPITDTGLRGIGSRDFATVQGPGHGEFNLSGMAEPTTLGHLLLGMMGAASDGSGGASNYIHTFTRGDSPPSYTFETGLKNTEAAGVLTGVASSALRYTGCRLSELGFNFDAQNGALMYSATLQGKIPAKVTAQPLTPAPEDPWAGWRGTVTSTGLAGLITSAQFTLSRALDVRHTAQNDQNPKSLIPGPLAFEGRLTILAADLVAFDTWKAYTTQSFQITFTYGTSNAVRTFTILATAMNLGHGPFEIDRGNEGVLFNMPFLALHNATDGGAVQILLTNETASY